MALDPRIILQGQGFQAPDMLGMARQAMTMKQLVNQGQAQERELTKQKTLQDIYKSSLVPNQDGTMTLDQKKLRGSLAFAGFGPEAQAIDNQIYQRDTAAKKSQQEQDQWQKTFSQKERELEIKRLETLRGAERKLFSGENLPLDQKKIVEGLSSTNARKIAIKNQIDATMQGWDSLSDDQKLSAGRQLLKTLNSPEGADAIGAEEAKRLGSRLEFAMGNFTNSNPTQFGRDLGGFKEQAMNTSSTLGKAVEENQKMIDQTMGRTQPMRWNQMTPAQAEEEFQAKKIKSKGNAGKTIIHNGKKYLVGEDGDTLTEVGG